MTEIKNPDCIVCSTFGHFGPSKFPTELEHDAGWHKQPEFVSAARRARRRSRTAQAREISDGKSKAA
jgi:hypothetical protein